MKPSKILLMMSAFLSLAIAGARGADLVILHTNDTHSQIDPNAKGEGGVLQRKALFDSIRSAEKNVITVDAGDAVQGSLYFKFFQGDVEYPLMDMMGYDLIILGNHEFDNGLESLAKRYKNVKASKLSSNYDFTSTPMDGIMKPWAIRKIGGKKIGFLGINIDPESLIASYNYQGMGFSDPIQTADSIAAMLRNDKGADLVVALTHIGAERENAKPIDYDLAAGTRDIDIIIGGHSHTLIPDGRTIHDNPALPKLVKNAAGRDVLVTQTGRYGRYVGYIKIDLDDLDEIDGKYPDTDDFDYRLLPVTDRFDHELTDPKIRQFLQPYRDSLESIQNRVIGYSLDSMESHSRTGSYANWTADVVRLIGQKIADSLNNSGMNIGNVDFGMANVGGIRHSMTPGPITEGLILNTFPFSNRVVLMKIKGSDFRDAMAVASLKGGESISEELTVVSDEEGNLQNVYLNGEEIDPEKTYLLSTIDYIAWGNDDFTPLKNGEIIYFDPSEMSERILKYIRNLTEKGLPLQADPRKRFIRTSASKMINYK